MTSVVRASRSLRKLQYLRCFSSSIPDVKEEGKSNSTGCSFIHPSAIVHPDAILGQGVSIGPFCTIGPSAKLRNACKLYPGSHVSGNAELGDNCMLVMGAVVGDEFPGGTVIGFNNIIGHHAAVGIKCQDMKYKEINAFLRLVTTTRSENTHQSTDLQGQMKKQTIIAVHQFCHIGFFSFIGGGSVVSQDVPKYTMVSGERAELRGLNLEGLRRSGFSTVEVKSLRAAYRKLYMPGERNSGSIEDRLTELEQDEELSQISTVFSMVRSIPDSFAENRRGICKFRS